MCPEFVCECRDRFTLVHVGAQLCKHTSNKMKERSSLKYFPEAVFKTVKTESQKFLFLRTRESECHNHNTTHSLETEGTHLQLEFKPANPSEATLLYIITRPG